MIRFIKAQHLRGIRICFNCEAARATGALGRDLPCPALGRAIFRLATASLTSTDIYMGFVPCWRVGIARPEFLFDKFNGFVATLALHPRMHGAD